MRVSSFALLLGLWPTTAPAAEPSREATLEWLVEHLPKMGGKLTDEPETNVVYVHPRADPERCRLTVVEWTFTGPEQNRKGVRQEMELPLDQLEPKLETPKPKGGGHRELRFRTADGKKSLEVRLESKLGNQFSTQRGQTAAWRLLDLDEAHLARVAKALEHAIRDCRGGSTSAGSADEPF